MQAQTIVKSVGDVTAYGTVVATLVGLLPSISAALAIIWLIMQMTEKAVGKPFHELVRCAWKKIRGKA